MLRLNAVRRSAIVGCGLLLASCASSPFDDARFENIQRHSARRAADGLSYGVATGGADAAIAEINAESSLRDCLVYAAANSPELRSAFYRWQAELERLPQVTALPDPRVSYGYFLNEIETRVGPQQHRFGVSQMFPWFGELNLRGDVAAAAARAQFERIEGVRLELFQRVKRAYNELYHLRLAIDLTRQNLELLQRFEEIARARYRVAAGGHPDIIRTQVELGRLEDRLREFQQRRDPLAARLNAALNRPPDAEAPWPDQLPGSEVDLDEEALIALLREHNPELVAMAQEIEQQRHAAELAKKDFYPDLTFSLDYVVTGEAIDSSINESGDDAIVAGVGFNVPIWREKYEAGVRESVNRRLAVAARRADAENRLVADLELALFHYDDARRRVALFRDTLLPKANESLEASLAGYQTGTVPFTDLLDAERVLLELQLSAVRAETDAANALAEIESLAATDVSTRPATDDPEVPDES